MFPCLSCSSKVHNVATPSQTNPLNEKTNGSCNPNPPKVAWEETQSTKQNHNVASTTRPRRQPRKPYNIIQATKNGDLEAVINFIAQENSVIDTLGMWENTPLIYACQYRHVDIALHLIDRGANVNHSNERGNTPLLHAAVEGLEQLASALLEKGANPNTPPSLIYNSLFDTSEYLTPLSAASLNGYNELLSMFLNHGASLDPPISNGNAKNQRGLTPLTLACTKIPSHLEKGQKNYNKLVSVLLQAGANVNQVNEHEQTALLVAVSSGLGEVVLTQLLSAGSDPTHQDCNGCTALFLAVKHNNPNAAMMLIEHGADVNQVHGEAQRTCLHEACSNSSAQCARILLNAGARPGVADAYGTYPLEIAQGGDDIELEVLIEQHIKLDKSDRVQRAEKCT